MHKINAIVLAAGAGKRMGAAVPKQYLPLAGKPLMVYALEAFQASAVNEIVLVVNAGEVEFCKKEIVGKYGLTKVTSVIEGGNERYDSVYRGLQASVCDYVMIHDSARAFVTADVIARAMEAVLECDACVVGVPSKDTIKLADEHGMVAHTPKRDKVWVIQTPQCFSYPLILSAYEKLFENQVMGVTDDAMVVEMMTETPVRLVQGDYENIKITTSEDLLIGERILANKKI